MTTRLALQDWLDDHQHILAKNTRTGFYIYNCGRCYESRKEHIEKIREKGRLIRMARSAEKRMALSA